MDISNSLHLPQAQDRNKMDLQKMLIDERMRCDTHKSNYQVLKEQHKLLQEENVNLQQDLARFKTTGAESADGLQTIINELRGQLATKEVELESVRGQALNPQKLEVIKAEITKELEGPLKDHVDAMDKEVEKYRAEYNKLRYEHTFLKSEYEHLKADHKRILEELTLKHHAQASALQQERDEAIKAYEDRPMPNVNDAQRIQMLQRNKSQLELRVKNLLEEMQEIRKQKEYAVTEADRVQRTQAQDIAQLQGNLKSTESERRSIEAKCERLQRELQSNSEHNTTLTHQLQEKEKECSFLKSTMNEHSHKHKVEMSNYKLKEMKIQGDLQREKDALQNKLRTLKTELEVLKHINDEHSKQIEEMERDAVRRVQEAKQEEWNRHHELQTEKIALEEKCHELKRRLAEEMSSRLNEREQADERLRILEANEASAQSEAEILRSRVESLSKSSSDLEKERENAANLRQKLHDKELELQTSLSRAQHLHSEMQRIKEDSSNCRKLVEESRIQAEKAEKRGQQAVEDQKLAGMEERHRLQSRVDKLEIRLSRDNENHEKAAKRNKKTQQHLVNKLKALKNRCQLLEAEKEHLEIEMKAGKHGVPMEEYNRMRKKLGEFQRKHNEFARNLGMSDIDKMVFHNTSAHYNTIFLPLSSTPAKRGKDGDSLYDIESKGLSQILDRLDQVEKQQRQTKEELEFVAKPTFISSNNNISKSPPSTPRDKVTPRSNPEKNDGDRYSLDSFESGSKTG